MLTHVMPGRARRIAGAAAISMLGLSSGYAAWAAAPATDQVAFAVTPTLMTAPPVDPATARTVQRLQSRVRQQLAALEPQPPATAGAPPVSAAAAEVFRFDLPANESGERKIVLLRRAFDGQIVASDAPELKDGARRFVLACSRTDGAEPVCASNGAQVTPEIRERLKALMLRPEANGLKAWVGVTTETLTPAEPE